MVKKERQRETVKALPTPDDVRARAEDGWQLVAVEWQREVEEIEEDSWHQTPYGLVTDEGEQRLRPHQGEEEALRVMLAMVIDDNNSLAQVADELNRRGLRTRDGGHWSQGAVFNMLPRLVDAAPRIFDSPAWQGGHAIDQPS